MSQLNGTALPSLALENFQEIENQKISGFERDKAEDVIAGALGSIYLGMLPTKTLDLIEIVLHSRSRYSKQTSKQLKVYGNLSTIF